MKKILVPHDFSPASENALNYAIELAGYFSAQLVLLNVSLYPILSPEMSIAAYSFEEMKQDGLDALQKLSEKIKLKAPALSEIECYSELGEVTDSITDYAAKQDIDMVVMGINTKESKLVKALVGSNAVDVSKKISKPLLIVPENVHYRKIQNVAYASDYDENLQNSSVLIKVKYFSTLFNAFLHVVHVIPEGHALSQKEAAADDFIEHTLQSAEHKTYLVNEDKVSTGIINLVKENKMDLIIAEPKNNSIFHGSVTKEIAFDSPVPVLMIHG